MTPCSYWVPACNKVDKETAISRDKDVGSNVMLDELHKVLEQRGHKFVGRGIFALQSFLAVLYLKG